MSYVMDVFERIRDLKTQGYDTSTRYVYHGSNDPNLDKKGIRAFRVDRQAKPYKRSYLAVDKGIASIYGKHTYQVDLHHPNLKKHVFLRGGDRPGPSSGPSGWINSFELLTRQDIPPGEHIKKIK